MSNKLDLEWYSVFFCKIFCDMLTFIAVDFYKQRNSFLALMFCVLVFIVAGFKYSIADIFYFCSTGLFSVKTLVFIVIVILGNVVSDMLILFCRRYIYDLKPGIAQ